ncbi:hypothetical protein [Roseomonas xinghualingensis]|uniref:hypothetical protein n=1 Tax=Roseomonas xinghualingensis TaxID=2986475 RepID=UPI0021F1AE55|nr:hypothetical protein [Roseomonas sp. SXEYE001]MCV4207038.1 hypothetical protein [Roseomonas sp. SXEYE001]
MLRIFAIALVAIVALAAVQPAEATNNRRAEARSAGKATRVATARPATTRQKATVARTTRQAAASRTTRTQARAATRRQAAAQTSRSNLRLVSLTGRPAAAATVSARRAKVSGKATRSRGMGVWHAGLPSPDGEQMDCPTGTMAVLARGHSDTFRCMPM